MTASMHAPHSWSLPRITTSMHPKDNMNRALMNTSCTQVDHVSHTLMTASMHPNGRQTPAAVPKLALLLLSARLASSAQAAALAPQVAVEALAKGTTPALFTCNMYLQLWDDVWTAQHGGTRSAVMQQGCSGRKAHKGKGTQGERHIRGKAYKGKGIQGERHTKGKGYRVYDSVEDEE